MKSALIYYETEKEARHAVVDIPDHEFVNWAVFVSRAKRTLRERNGDGGDIVIKNFVKLDE